MKQICVYHSRDLDGWMSAAIVKSVYPLIELCGWDYGEPTPELSEYSQIIMVDISFPTENMYKLHQLKKAVTWIDHHKSAIEDSEKQGYANMGGKRDSDFAACELAWMYYYPDAIMPETVRLLGRYDCFGHIGLEEEDKIFAFQYAARAYIGTPDEAASWLQHFNDDWIDQKVSFGFVILKYLTREGTAFYGKNAFPFQFAEYEGVAINRARFNPKTFDIDYSEYDFCAAFYFDGKNWQWSLYSDTIDVSGIAKEMGGGGHKGAAGFVSDSLDFIKEKVPNDIDWAEWAEAFPGQKSKRKK